MVKYFKLTTDLDMGSLSWTPIGTDSNWFEGHFDGDNHLIDDLYITNCKQCGLFGVTSANMSVKNVRAKVNIMATASEGGAIIGYVKNTSNTGGLISDCHCVKGSTITIDSNSSKAGGIIGHARYISITNCTNRAVISAKYNTGGVAGMLFYSTISNCNNTGDIVSTSGYSGGIAGNVFNGMSATVNNCYNTGEIHGGRSGGLFGDYQVNTSYNTITKCYNTGNVFGYWAGGLISESSKVNINNSYNIGDVTATSGGDAKAGGLVAYLMGNTNFSNCFNTGNVTSTSIVGGILGQGPLITLDESTISNCYNSGDVSAIYHESTSFYEAGGIVSYGGYLSINNCYNTGNVSATYLENKSWSGGIMGNCWYYINFRNCYNTGIISGHSRGGIRGKLGDDVVVTNCYCLENCGGTVSGGTPKAETVMKSSSFPSTLNSGTSVYKLDLNPPINQGYPIFNNAIYAYTLPATALTRYTATLNGAYSGTVSAIGFRYKNILETEYNYEYVQGASPVSINVVNLQEGATYEYQIFVQANNVTYYGEPNIFSTIGVGINDDDIPSKIVLYPNPAHDQFFVQCAWNEEITDMQIQLMDIYGKLLRRSPVVGETTPIDVSDLSDVVCFVQLVQRNTPICVRKLVKAR